MSCRINMYDKEQIKNMGRNLIENVDPSSNENINIITEHCVVKKNIDINVHSSGQYIYFRPMIVF